MTPERAAYMRALSDSQRHLAAAQKELDALLRGAAEFDLVLSIEHLPKQPLAMGNYEVVGSARLTRERYQKLETLRQRAEASENPVKKFKVTIVYSDGTYENTVHSDDATSALQLARGDARMARPGRTFYGKEISHTVEEMQP